MHFPASENTNRIEPQKNTYFSEEKYVCKVWSVLSIDQPPQAENHTLHDKGKFTTLFEKFRKY